MRPVNPNATYEAIELLDYLYRTVSDGKIITGQHTQTNLMEEVTYIYDVTGKRPKLQGFELLSYSPNINWNDASEECLTEIRENQGTVETALRWVKETKGIVSICFHWYSPVGGRDKSFYQKNTDFDANKILQPGTKERKAFYSDMDVIAEELEKFRRENIPVLWRPFHEADGDWFWWGAKGHETAKQLYRMMFDYYVHEKHLDNLLWVWNSPAPEGYPGDEYCDVISRDIYVEKGKKTDYAKEYEELRQITSAPKVAALGEVGINPDAEILLQNKTPWAYYMTWSKEFCMTEDYNTKESLCQLYSSTQVITL